MHHYKLKVLVNITVNFLELSSMLLRFYGLRFLFWSKQVIRKKNFNKKLFISTALFMVKKLQTVLFFVVLRITRTKTYGSYNSIKDLAFFKISSQRWSVITMSITLFLSLFCFALILGESWNSPNLIRIFSVYVTTSAVSCEFSHIYWRNPYWKILFFM